MSTYTNVKGGDVAIQDGADADDTGYIEQYFKDGSRVAGIAIDGGWIGTSSSANAIAVGLNGSSNPAFKVDANTASSATGLKITSAAAAGGVAVAAISSGTNENMTVDAKGSGTITLGGTSTGAIALSRATGITGAATVTSASATALTVGLAGATNPALVVDASTGSSATGVSIKSAAAASGVAVAAVSSGTNENLTIDAKGSGTIGLNVTGTGAITLGRAVVLSNGIGTVAATGPVTTTAATAGSGYATGAGGAVVQITNSATGVTLSKPCGQITTVALTTAAAAEERFTVTNTLVAATDVVVVSTTYNGAGTPMVGVVNTAAGAFDIVITNLHAANALNAVLVVNFAIQKAVAS